MPNHFLPGCPFLLFGFGQAVPCCEVAGGVQGKGFLYVDMKTCANDETFLKLLCCLFLLVGHHPAQDCPTFCFFINRKETVYGFAGLSDQRRTLHGYYQKAVFLNSSWIFLAQKSSYHQRPAQSFGEHDGDKCRFCMEMLRAECGDPDHKQNPGCHLEQPQVTP